MSTLSCGDVQAVHELDPLPWLQAKQLITFAEWQVHSGRDLAGAEKGLQRAISQLLQLEQSAGAGAGMLQWKQCCKMPLARLHWPHQPWGVRLLLSNTVSGAC